VVRLAIDFAKLATSSDRHARSIALRVMFASIRLIITAHGSEPALVGEIMAGLSFLWPAFGFFVELSAFSAVVF